MFIGKRLERIKEMCKGSHVLADIGCDHAYLPLSLVKDKIIDYAYAIDNKIEPLNQAKKNIEKEGLSSQIETILSDGLINLSDKEFDTVVMAGLGAITIIEIMGKSLDLFKDKTLILEANKGSKELRKFLMDNSYIIIDEDIIEEANHFYEIIKTKHSFKKENYTELELAFGPINLKNKKRELFDYLNYNLEILNRVEDKRETLIKKINLYRRALDEIRTDS